MLGEKQLMGNIQYQMQTLLKYFDNVRHHILFYKIAKRVNDDDVMHLIKLICKANGKKGVPQGGVISLTIFKFVPCNEVDEMFTRAKAVVKSHYGTELSFYRFADDMICLVKKLLPAYQTYAGCKKKAPIIGDRATYKSLTNRCCSGLMDKPSATNFIVEVVSLHQQCCG